MVIATTDRTLVVLIDKVSISGGLSCILNASCRVAIISKRFVINGVIMFHFKSKNILLPLIFSVLAAVLSPALSQAEETYGTGDIASSRAAEQRAAIAKRKERIRMEKEAEAKKTDEAQKEQASTMQQPAQDQAEKSAAQ